METTQTDVQETTATPSVIRDEQPLAAAGRRPAEVYPQSCSSCGAAQAGAGAVPVSPNWIYAIGHIEARFPSISVEKELAQVVGRSDTEGKSDREAMQTVLSNPDNRYLARQLCWVMTIQGLETYILAPRDPADLTLLTNALKVTHQPLHVVIGIKGSIAPATMCNGLMVPIVIFDQIYSFDRPTLIKAAQQAGGKEKGSSAATEEVFDRIMQITDNAGSTDEHRALNYLAVRYQAIYSVAAEAFNRNSSLTAVDVRPSPVSATRNIVDVIFTYTNRETDFEERFAVGVDVTEKFPFLVRKLGPWYSRS